jgi:hypothetical protein
MASSGPPRQDPFTGATWLVWACAQAALGTSGAIIALAAVDALTLALQRRAGSVGNVPIGGLAATATTSLGNVTRSSQTSGYYALIRWYQFVQVTLRRARLCACVFSDWKCQRREPASPSWRRSVQPFRSRHPVAWDS